MYDWYFQNVLTKLDTLISSVETLTQAIYILGGVCGFAFVACCIYRLFDK